MACCTFDPQATVDGELPPWEVAKAFAYHVVRHQAAETLGVQPSEMIGQVVAEFIAARVVLKGWGHPHPRAVQKVIARCRDPN